MTNWRSPYSQITMVSFEYIDFWPKILLFRTHHLWNSTTELILSYIPRAIRHVNLLSRMSYLDTYILILRANKKQRMKNITKYGHNCKHRKHITITFQVVNFYWLIILIILVSSPHAHFKETYSLRGNSGILEFQSNFVCRQ